ncbi:uncharacterized protein LOC117490598 [Xyrichtys novacula]|uniref:Uncharacterized protein LOC117490598 n=1 Tax=Xyrichtys novacula TaxID=13765 RepID=A0AAV1F8G9_XYRNO|nr:uncharacterized protein LOC117490598 [Xyrichtys novacula]
MAEETSARQLNFSQEETDVLVREVQSRSGRIYGHANRPPRADDAKAAWEEQQHHTREEEEEEEQQQVVREEKKEGEEDEDNDEEDQGEPEPVRETQEGARHRHKPATRGRRPSGLVFTCWRGSWGRWGRCLGRWRPSHAPGYSYLHQPRLTGRSGGVAVIHKQTLKTTPVPTLSVHSFEDISVKLPSPTLLVIVTVYCPPKPHPSFLSDFSDFVTHLSTISSSVLLLGDFSFHIDNPTWKQASDFPDLLDTLNLTQHVHSPTHSHSHILDLICSTGMPIHHLSTINLYISDHLAVTFNVDPPPPLHTLNSAHSSFYSNLIHSGSSNRKALFSTVKKLLHPIDSTSITFTPEKCNSFLSSFQSKINTIYNSLSPPSIPSSSPHPFSTLLLLTCFLN